MRWRAKVPNERKTPDTTLIYEIIGIGWGSSLSGLQLIIVCGRSMGLSHPLFDAQREWDQLKFSKMDNIAKRLLLALRRSGVRPCNLSDKHLQAWAAGCVDRGQTHVAARQSIAQFKLAVRASGLQSNFPNLDVELKGPEQYCVAIEDMHPRTWEQLQDALHALEKLDTAGIISKTESTRGAFTEAVRQLYGLALAQPDVMKMIGGAVTDLQQILDQEVFSQCVRMGYHKKGWTRDTTRMFVHRFHSVFKVVSPYCFQNWEWMSKLVAEFPEDPEKKKEETLAARAFNYDYDAVETIPAMILGKRMETEDLSDREREWSIQCEFVMLFLVTDPWPLQCLAHCTVYSEGANLYEKDGRWFFRFHALEVPFRRAAQGPVAQRLVPLLRLYLKYRGDQPGPLLRNRKGGAFTSARLSELVKDLTETYVQSRVPASSFRDIFAYWWLFNNPDLNGYTSLAQILWISIHACRMRYDKDYRAEYLAKHPRRRSRPHS